MFYTELLHRSVLW